MEWDESKHPRDKQGRFTDIQRIKKLSSNELRRLLIQNNENFVKIALNFFNEKAIENQSDNNIIKGIKTLQKRISEHKEKIAHPEKLSMWNTYSEAKKAGTIRHWEKEIQAFEIQLENRKNILKKRGKTI